MKQGGAVDVAELVEVAEPGAELVVRLSERPPGGVLDEEVVDGDVEEIGDFWGGDRR